MLGPLGKYGIAKSLVQTPGWKPLEAEGPLEQALGGGGGGGGFSMGFGGRQGPNQMEQTIDAHDYPGGFKVATDQYAARYSDQLDAAALLELKDKFPGGPKAGGTWEQEFARQAAAKANYQKTGKLWGVPDNLRTYSANNAENAFQNMMGGGVSQPKYSGGPLKGKPSRDRSGLASRVVNFGSGGSSSRGGRRGARAGRSAVKNSNPSRGFRRYGL
jgi:hypothetical protein